MTPYWTSRWEIRRMKPTKLQKSRSQRWFSGSVLPNSPAILQIRRQICRRTGLEENTKKIQPWPNVSSSCRNTETEWDSTPSRNSGLEAESGTGCVTLSGKVDLRRPWSPHWSMEPGQLLPELPAPLSPDTDKTTLKSTQNCKTQKSQSDFKKEQGWKTHTSQFQNLLQSCK